MGQGISVDTYDLIITLSVYHTTDKWENTSVLYPARVVCMKTVKSLPGVCNQGDMSTLLHTADMPAKYEWPSESCSSEKTQAYWYLSSWSMPPLSFIHFVENRVIWGDDSKNGIQTWCKQL